MNKIKYIIGILIVIVGILCFNLINREYYQKKDKRNINTQYLALDGETALKNITIKKEMIEPKEYYTAGDEIKYKFTVTNNNSETVKINLIDNINNLGKTQNNLMLKKVICKEKEISISNNQIFLNNIEIESKEVYTCNIEAKARDTYTVGNVKSKIKVYIDDLSKYIESQIDYEVQEKLTVLIDKPSNFVIYDTDNINYFLKLKNNDQKNSTGKIEVIISSSLKQLRLNTPFESYYSFSLTEKNTLDSNIDNTKLRVTCKSFDGSVCTIDAPQQIVFELKALNPNEALNLELNFDFITNILETLDGTINVLIREIDKDDNSKILYRYNKKHNISVKANATDYNNYNMVGQLYPLSLEDKIIYDIHDLPFNENGALMYVKYDFLRTLNVPFQFDSEKNTITQILPSSILYDNTRENIIENCSPYDFKSSKKNTGATEIVTLCGLGLNSSPVYKASVKVPLIITGDAKNKEVCLESDSTKNFNEHTNKFCVGPNLSYTHTNAIQYYKDIEVDINLRNNGNGYGKNVQATYKYDEGLTIDKSSIVDGDINETTRTITWTIPVIKPNDNYKITFKAKNNNNLTRLSLQGEVEGNEYNESVIIFQAEVDYFVGDWNIDGTININDAIYARKYIARLGDVVLPPAQVYDLNGDNNPTISDLVLLRKLISEGKN